MSRFLKLILFFVLALSLLTAEAAGEKKDRSTKKDARKDKDQTRENRKDVSDEDAAAAAAAKQAANKAARLKKQQEKQAGRAGDDTTPTTDTAEEKPPKTEETTPTDQAGEDDKTKKRKDRPAREKGSRTGKKTDTTDTTDKKDEKDRVSNISRRADKQAAKKEERKKKMGCDCNTACTTEDCRKTTIKATKKTIKDNCQACGKVKKAARDCLKAAKTAGKAKAAEELKDKTGAEKRKLKKTVLQKHIDEAEGKCEGAAQCNACKSGKKGLAASKEACETQKTCTKCRKYCN